MKQLFCTKCKEYKDIIIKTETETYPVKGEPVSISAQVSYCIDCGEQLFNSELDNENLKTAYRLYRARHKLLQPEEIKAIRDKYALSQVIFARILGLGEKTVTRYENGSLQDESQNNLLVLADDINNFELLLDKHECDITQAEYERTKAIIQSLRYRAAI